MTIRKNRCECLSEQTRLFTTSVYLKDKVNSMTPSSSFINVQKGVILIHWILNEGCLWVNTISYYMFCTCSQLLRSYIIRVPSLQMTTTCSFIKHNATLSEEWTSRSLIYDTCESKHYYYLKFYYQSTKDMSFLPSLFDKYE